MSQLGGGGVTVSEFPKPIFSRRHSLKSTHPPADKENPQTAVPAGPTGLFPYFYGGHHITDRNHAGTIFFLALDGPYNLLFLYFLPER